MKKHLTKSQVGYICTDLDHYCSKSWITKFDTQSRGLGLIWNFVFIHI